MADKYLTLTRNVKFEQKILEATEQAVREMDKMAADEVKLRYITHVFARTLDVTASWIVKSHSLN